MKIDMIERKFSIVDGEYEFTLVFYDDEFNYMDSNSFDNETMDLEDIEAVARMQKVIKKIEDKLKIMKKDKNDKPDNLQS